jgi:hypothetical protein
MEATAQRQLRPYLSMDPILIGGFYDGGIVRVEFVPKNHGLTPASDIVHRFEMGVVPIPIPPEASLPKATNEIPTRTTVFSDSLDHRTWFDAGSPIAQEQVDRVAAGTAAFCCWGVTSYTDVYNERHTVKFYLAVTGQNFVDAQRQHRDGKRKDLPNWRWEYGSGHGHFT